MSPTHPPVPWAPKPENRSSRLIPGAISGPSLSCCYSHSWSKLSIHPDPTPRVSPKWLSPPFLRVPPFPQLLWTRALGWAIHQVASMHPPDAEGLEQHACLLPPIIEDRREPDCLSYSGPFNRTCLSLQHTRSQHPLLVSAVR